MSDSGDKGVDLVEAAKQVSVREDNETAKTMILAGTSLIPAIGGALSVLLNDYLPNSYRIRLKEFLALLAADVDRVKSRVDAEAAKSESYGLMYLHVLRQVATTDVEEKLRAYRAILVNSLMPDGLKQIERDYFLSLVEQLRQIHFVVLSLYRDPHQFATVCQKSWPRNDLSVALVDCLEQHDINDDLFTRAIDDLQRLSILENALSDARHLADNGRRRICFFERPSETDAYWRELPSRSLESRNVSLEFDPYESDYDDESESINPVSDHSESIVDFLPDTLGEVADVLAQDRLQELNHIGRDEELAVLRALDDFWDRRLSTPLKLSGSLTAFGERFADFVALPS